MRKELIFVALGFIFSSCAPKIDNSDPISFGYSIDKSFRENNLSVLYPFSKFNETNMALWQREEIEKIKAIYDSELKLVDIEFLDRNLLYLDYVKNEIYYKIIVFLHNDSLGGFFVDKIAHANLSEKCEEYKKEIYSPFISFDYLQWWISDYNPRQFTKGSIKIQNTSGLDIDYLKFQLRIDNNEFVYNRTFFQQTIEIYRNIYKGDIIWVDIPGMNDFFTDFDIYDAEIVWKADVIEARPKPANLSCDEIKKIEAKLKETI